MNYKVLKFNTEAATGNKVIELTQKGAHFHVVGRREIWVFDEPTK